MTKSLLQHATAHIAQLDRPIADEAMRRLADSSDVLLIEVDDNRFLAQLRQSLDTSTKPASEGKQRCGVRTAKSTSSRDRYS